MSMQNVQSAKLSASFKKMFPYVEPYEKSPEISQYEAHTGKPFVKSHNVDEWRSSWAESGENPYCPRFVYFDPNFGRARVFYGLQPYEALNRGVRRLLRVKKGIK